MREEEQKTGETWKQRFFTWVENDEIASGLKAELAVLTGNSGGNGNVGSWTFTPDPEDSKAMETGTLFNGQ